jgi:hypothetical protein
MSICCKILLAYFSLTVVVGMLMFVNKRPETVIEGFVSFVDSISSKPVEKKYSRRYTEPSVFE